ncbi:MAG: serine--tRNA ligase [Bacteroidota bacterium]
MLTINTLREERQRVITGLDKRNIDAAPLIDAILTVDDERKSIQTELDQLLGERNSISKEIGKLFKSGQAAEANEKRERVNVIKERVSTLEAALAEVKDNLAEQLYGLPNVPHESVAKGAGEEDNEVYRPYTGELPDLGEAAQPHWEIAEQYGIFDLELGVKLTGSGFPVFRGQGAKLQRGLIAYFLDQASEAGFEEFQVPHIVNESSARATGQLPDKEGQMYYINEDDFYLIPTAEVPLTNMYRDVILEESDFPIKLTGHTPCFRREAGSYGAHVRGLNRVHQFDKVEIVQIAHPDRSYEVLHEMVDHVAKLLDTLELPYRILRLCGGDTGFTSALTYDFEVWSAAQKRWLEVSSVSNFETFQTNRLKLRFRDGATKKTRLAHSLNGSALALPRIIAALLENNQSPEGIILPQVLHPYVGKSVLVAKA